MKFRILITALLFVCLFNVKTLYAQRKIQQIDPEKEQDELEQPKTKSDFWEKTSFGGNVSASFASGNVFVSLQPMMFYRLKEKTTVGGGISYFYWEQNVTSANGTTQKYSDNAYGLNLFGRQDISQSLFVHAEYSPMNFEVYQPATADFKREWVSALYFGAGINQRFSNRSGVYIMMLYDVLYDQSKSFKGRPIEVRMGFYL